ncbi:MAG: DeoR/GlpR family DNA-binding transcription regulator [Cytophagaceae bacterium]|nr:DeoR/GlpR family DNA-binding transcription regulator [Cytophagaceae bacterium]
MLREERLQLILKKVSAQHRVSSVELSLELDVSDDTIRRDLNELAHNGFLKKVHGGAIPTIPKAPAPFKLSERVRYAQGQKEVISEKALKLFENGQIVILDNGSTNMLIASKLPAELSVTIFTNSVPIAQILCEHPTVEVVLLGGRMFKRAQVAVGVGVIETLSRLRADLCIVGVCSIHPAIGVTTPDWEESLVKQKMVDVSKRVVATAWQDKFDTADSCLVCPFDELDVLVTDSTITARQQEEYSGKGVEIW